LLDQQYGRIGQLGSLLQNLPFPLSVPSIYLQTLLMATPYRQTPAQPLHNRSPRFDTKCPACNHTSECNGHLFQCKALTRRRWLSSFIQSTRKRAKACNTDPKLVHILIAGIRSYFDSCSPPHAEFAGYPPPLPPTRQLAISQTTIGWGPCWKAPNLLGFNCETKVSFIYSCRRFTCFSSTPT
jgi:hypothetical protein